MIYKREVDNGCKKNEGLHYVRFKKPVYLMPFTVNSMLLFNYLINNNTDVFGFCDNRIDLHGKEFFEKKIYSPEQAFIKNPDSYVIISEPQYFDILIKQLQKIGFNDNIKITKLNINFDLNKYIDILNFENYRHLAPRQFLLGESLIKAAPHLKTWETFINQFIDKFNYPYKFDENNSYYENLNEINSNKRFIICINATKINTNCFNNCLKSITSQRYKNFIVLIIYTNETNNYVKKELKKLKEIKADFLVSKKYVNNIDIIKFARDKFNEYKNYDFIVTLGADDELSKNALIEFVFETDKNEEYNVFTANEDRIYNDEYIAPYYKKNYQNNKSIGVENFLRNIICVNTRFNGRICELNLNNICVVDEVLYHYRIYIKKGNDSLIKPIAFYLTQFHAIPENDEWWGKGFTEWTNVKRAEPMFEGHNQPRIPGELGYYDLIKDKDIQKRQIDLAKKHGIYGFCYYYYWFEGRRLLEKPLDNFLRNLELDMPFCICWANENWSRRWDGLENEILLAQKHTQESDEQFILDVIPILKDPRYIKVNGAPYLLIYKCNLFPDFKKTVEVWRKIAKENGLAKIHVSVINTVDWVDEEFNDLGCDSETEFPPWGMNLSEINDKVKSINKNFIGRIRDYNEYVYRFMNIRKHNKRLCFRGIMLGFDNTARRLLNAGIHHGSTPENYKKLLMSLVDYTSRNSEEERFIFINAWNEWAEGNHLEPDEKYGDAYLRATNEAIKINC